MLQADIIARNHLLAALKPSDRAPLLVNAQVVALKQRQVLFEVGGVFKYLYFPGGGAASVLTTMQNGTSVEVGMVGMEGLVSVSALLGDEHSAQHIVVQLPGYALRVGFAACRAAFESNQAVCQPFLQYADSFLKLAGRSAACHRLHAAPQRMARWLLMSYDRYGAAAMPLTQEYLAIMLGVRRAGVTEVAVALQRAGLIQYTPGQITVVDPEGLARTACECYALDREQFLQKP